MIVRELNSLDILQITEITKDKDFIFFDMDGTILNSEVAHFKAINQLCDGDCGYTIDDLYGLPDSDIYPLISKRLNTDLETFLSNKNSILLDVISKTSIAEFMMPNMLELIIKLKAEKKIALVTASEDVITTAILTHCKLIDLFDIIITSQSVKHTKPSPDPYQLALKMLETTKENAIVFEDSPTGIEAARQAGIDTVKVTWYEG